MKNKDNIEYYYSVYLGMVQRYDDTDKVSWITTENGTHIPIDKEGTAVGGALKGESFKDAKSQPSKPKGKKRNPLGVAVRRSGKIPTRSSLKHGFGRTKVNPDDRNGTLQKYSTADGIISPERAKLHESIVQEHFRGVQKPKGEQIYTFLGGGPASGKSTVTKNKDLNLGIPDDTHAVVIDVDEIKDDLPEYRERVAKGDKKAAGYVHEESSALGKRVNNVALENGYDVVMDGCGDGSAKSMINKIENARNHGCKEVNAVYVTCPTEDAIKRAIGRGEKTGRLPNLDITLKTHTGVSAIFEEIAPHFDKVSLYDTSGTSVKEIARCSRGGKVEVLDQKLYDSFLAKATEDQSELRKKYGKYYV